MALEFFSFNYILRKTKKTFLRFPFAVILSFLAVIAGILIIENGKSIELSIASGDKLINFIFTAVFGLPLFVSAEFFSETQKLKKVNKYILQLAVIPILILYYIFLPDLTSFDRAVFESTAIRVYLFIIAAYILVLFAPFLGRLKEMSGWLYYLFIFIRRFIFTVFLAGILYLGVIFILLSINYLFEIEILEERIFWEPWIFITGIVTLIFFLAGIPENTMLLEKRDYKPKYIQYILLPLMAVYGLLLYIYGIKILVTWNLPEGGVANLVIAFMTASICTFLLMHSFLRKNQKYFKLVFITLMPLLLLLFAAIGVRIYDYGFTEKRYFILIFGFWFLAVSLYFLTSKKKNILFIPITLFCLILLSSFGPWGAFSISERSQVKRLEYFLIKDNILKDGKIVSPYKKKAISEQDKLEISSILYYLSSTHGFQKIQNWFPPEVQDILKEPPNMWWETVPKIEYLIGIRKPYP